MKTTILFFAENSMIALIIVAMPFSWWRRPHAAGRRLHLAFGIDEKVPRGNYALPASKSGDNFDTLAIQLTGPNLAGLEVAIAPIDEHSLPLAGIQHRVRWNRELRGSREPKLDIGVHVQFERR